MNETLTTWGFDEVPIHFDFPPGHPELLAAYDPAEEAIYVNPNLLVDVGDDVDSVLITLIHEVLHAMEDQAGWQEFTEWEILSVSQGVYLDAIWDCISEIAESGAASNVPDYSWVSTP
jgi:hypothetical protein